MKAVVYSKDNCQWCDRVRQLLRSIDIKYIEYKYGVDYTKHEFQEEFGCDATFPQVQINNKHIGGCKDTLHYLKAKNLI